MFATGVVKTQVENYRNNFIIPRSAVLWTGKRSIVYVKKPGTEEPVFSLREITLGPSLGNSYVVLDGLSEGEVIVTNGTFSIDAAAQLEGKPSMMNMTDSSGSQHNTPSAESKENKPDVEQTSKISFTVSGNCDLCKERIEKSALSVAGVSNASWNVGTKKITVAFNKIKTTKMKIEKAIAASGHDTEDIKAGDAAYNALPACCKYRSKSE
jgi:Cu(I)/Ag(I) efflux system membrane fusion protein